MSDYGYGGPAPVGPGGYGDQRSGSDYGGPGGPGARPPEPPVGVGDLLGSTARAIASNLPTFAVAALVFTLPGHIISAIGNKRFTESLFGAMGMGQGRSPEAIFEAFDFVSIGILLVGLMVTLVAHFLCQATLVYPSAESVAGNQVSPGEALAKGFRATPSVLAIAVVLLMFYVLSMVPGMVAWLLIVMGMGAAAGGGADPTAPMMAMCCGCPIAFFAIIVPIYWVFILFLFAIPAAVVERVGPVRALQRSIELTRGHRWKLVGGTLVLFLITLVIGVAGLIVVAPFGGGFDFSTGQPQAPSTLGVIVTTVIGIAQTMVSQSLFSAFSGTAYARIRGADEGVDAASIANVFS